MMKIAVVTDSSAGVSVEQARMNDIFIARMPLSVDGKEFVEEEGLTRQDLIVKMRRGSSVSTSQPPMGAVMTLFESLLETHDHVIFLPISSALSGTYQTVCGIANDYKGKITVIDSRFVSFPLFRLALDVKALVDQGETPEAIKIKVERDAEMFASLIPDDIQYLKRGGRITPAAAAIANLLKIIPVLKVAQGEIDLMDKVRTYKKAVKLGVERVLEGRSSDDYEFFVLDGDADSKTLHMVIDMIAKEVGVKPSLELLYPIVLAHTGPGSIGIGAYKKLVK